jgi:hypothetical protein
MNYYNQTCSEVNYIVKDLRNDPQRMILHELTNILSKNSKFYIYGGYIRDLMIEYHHNIRLQKKDIDIIVDSDIPLDPLLAQLPGNIGKTSFGGTRWYPFSKYHLYVDIWRIQDNINIKMQNITPTIVNAISGPVFNLNRICFDLIKQELIEYEALSGIKKKQISYYLNNENRDQFHAARAALMQRKTSFDFDSSVITMINESNWKNNKNSIEEYLNENHYTTAQISFVFDFLSKFSKAKNTTQHPVITGIKQFSQTNRVAGVFSPSPHNTPHAGLDGAFHKAYRAIAG